MVADGWAVFMAATSLRPVSSDGGARILNKPLIVGDDCDRAVGGSAGRHLSAHGGCVWRCAASWHAPARSGRGGQTGRGTASRADWRTYKQATLASLCYLGRRWPLELSPPRDAARCADPPGRSSPRPGSPAPARRRRLYSTVVGSLIGSGSSRRRSRTRGAGESGSVAPKSIGKW
jgi:hypothetical protein